MASTQASLDRTHATLNRLIQELRDEGDDGPSAGDCRHDEIISSTSNARDQLLTETSTATGQTTYAYNANGSTISVTTPSGTKNYQWDLRNKLIALDADGNGQFTDAGDVAFAYDHEGVRVARSQIGGQTVHYLQTLTNPTGYSQALEEWTTPDALAPAALDRSYLIGQDVLAQSRTGAPAGREVEWMLYDGGGHTRGLLDATGQPLTGQIYAYDAYGNRLDPQTPIVPATNLLYRGEYFDALLGQYVLRARYYDPTSGRFWSFDSYEAGSADPLGLHKYLYCHGNPINGIDPTGHMEFSLGNLLVVGGIKGLLMGMVIGGVMREASYFISTPTDEWSTTGALAAFGKGAVTGAFGATLIGSAYFALEGIYSGIQVWRNPNATGLQKALASVNMLVGLASAYLLKGQVKSQWMEWKNIYSKVPLSTSVQTDLKAIRNAFNEGKDSVTIGKTTILFSDNPKVYGGTFGNPNEFYITKNAVAASDEILMKTIIEENLHNGRIVGNYLTNGLSGAGAAVGQGAAVQAEEQVVKGLVEDIYQRGRQAGWW